MYTTLLSGILSGIGIGSIFALIAIGVSIFYRGTGIVNMAHGSTIMVSGFIAVEVSSHLGSPLATLVVAAVAGAVIGALLFLAVMAPLRTRITAGGFGWVALTLAVMFILGGVAALIWGEDSRPLPALANGGYHIGPAYVSWQKTIAFIILIAVVVLLWWMLMHTTVGRMLRASAADGVGAVSVGINRTSAQTVSMAISGALAGLVACLMLPIDGVTPESGLSLTMVGLSAAVLGRIGNIPGAALGGLALGVVTQVVSGFWPSWTTVAEFSVLLIGIVARPGQLKMEG